LALARAADTHETTTSREGGRTFVVVTLLDIQTKPRAQARVEHHDAFACRGESTASAHQ